MEMIRGQLTSACTEVKLTSADADRDVAIASDRRNAGRVHQRGAGVVNNQGRTRDLMTGEQVLQEVQVGVVETLGRFYEWMVTPRGHEDQS